MGKAVKALSIVLILASLFGLAGGSLSLKDALGSKTYWENASGGGDSIGMLEDGLKQLKDNEAAYLAGRDQLNAGKEAYEAGVKALEEGQAQYDEGVKTLEEKQAEYDAGVIALAEAEEQLREGRHKLYDGEKQYAAGEAALAQAKALQAGLGQIVSGFGTWQQGYQGLQQFQASAGLPAPAAENVATYNAAIEAAKAQVATGLDYCDKKDLLEAALAGKPSKADLQASLAAAGNPTKETLQGQKTALETAIASAKEADPNADTSVQEAQLAQVNAGLQAYAGIEAYDNLALINAGLGTETRETLTAKKSSLDQLTGVPQAVADGQKTLAGGLSTAVNGALGNEDMAKELTSSSGMSADQLKGTVAALSGMDYGTFNAAMGQMTSVINSVAPKLAKTISDGEAQLAAAKKQLEKGHYAYNTGREQYEEGKAKLEEGAVLLEEGKAKLEAAAKQLEEGKAQLADAEKQIADGEKQLAVFEDGRDQVIAGLKTAIGTEAYEGTQSIADRLGENFSFMKNDTDLDIDKGLEVVAAARAYAADTAGAVTKEITGKAVGSIVAIAGSAIALLGGVLGLALKKPGFSGVVALLGGAAAAGGAVISSSVGSFFSQVAGAAGPTLLTAAGAVTAVAAVVQAISAFSAKGAAASAAAAE